MMNRRAHEDERLRGAHLVILAELTIAFLVVSAVALRYGWGEKWMVPLLFCGVILSWHLHIGGVLSPAKRLWVYAAVGWAVYLLDCVHSTVVFDIAVFAALQMLLYSRTEDRRLLHVTLGIYGFCLVWQIRALVTGEGLTPDSLVITQLSSHALFLFVIYLVCLSMMSRRNADLAEDEAAISELKLSQRRTEDFLAGISRELREPVGAVMECAQEVAREPQDEQERENAENVLRAGRRLSAQVDDLLDYMQIETGELAVTEETYRVSALLNGVISELGLYAEPDLPDILLDVDANTPAALHGAKELTGKILKQMIGNAVKFTPAGGVYVRIYPDRHGDSFNLCMDVQDTGIGMTRKELERVRHSAYQADADRTRRTGGLGLGFPVINGFTRALHGFSNITSVRGEGTKIHISLPVGAADDTPCMKIKHPEKLRTVFYQDPAKFAVPAVRDFYAQMVYHVIRDFKLTLQRVTTMKDLEKLLAEGDYTHLFTADEEYSRNPAYFDALAQHMHVIVVAKKTFRETPSSQVTVLRKPLYSFPLVMVLNAETPQDAQKLLNQRG